MCGKPCSDQRKILRVAPNRAQFGGMSATGDRAARLGSAAHESMRRALPAWRGTVEQQKHFVHAGIRTYLTLIELRSSKGFTLPVRVTACVSSNGRCDAKVGTGSRMPGLGPGSRASVGAEHPRPRAQWLQPGIRTGGSLGRYLPFRTAEGDLLWQSRHSPIC